MKTLVVDDDALLRELLCEMLDAFGYQDIVQAENGEDALAKIKCAGAPFDCFMLDIQMPGMDGIELCSHIRAMPQYADSPVIMITAMSQKDYIDRAFAAGATDYVTKPFDTTELSSRIKLADRLQSETRRVRDLVAASSANPTPQTPVIPFSEPVNLSEIRGFVNPAILVNYVKVTRMQKAFPLCAIAIQVPELEVVHAGSSPEEFNYVVMDIGQVLCDLFVGSQAFMTYLGGGIFLCVGNSSHQPDEATLEQNLVVLLNDEDVVYCEDVQTSFSPVVGKRAAPSFLENKENTDFLDRAIDNLRISQQESSNHRSKWQKKNKLFGAAA